MNARKKISIVSPCYNEEANVQYCWQAVKDIFDKTLEGYEREHIFADNASTDSSVAILRSIAQRDPNVKVIVNARNYGPFRSTFNALKTASGDAILVMLPVDLQDPPELLPEFVRLWETGNKVVYGVRTNREEGFIMRRLRRLFYWAVNRFSYIHIPRDTAEFQLIDRQVLDALKQFNDHYPYLRGMIANCGFKSASIPYTWRARKHGMSKNKMFHLIDQALNGFISFSTVPMRFAVLSGFAIAFLSVGYAVIQLLINVFMHGELVQPGIATLIVALFFFSGVQLLFIGLIGEYVASTHTQVRQGGIVVEAERINYDSQTKDKAA